MRTWPSLVLELLARLMKRGANVLGRQGEKLDRLARQQLGGEPASESAESDAAVSNEHRRSQRSSGPPAHWLEKVEGSEHPAPWIDHAEDQRSEGVVDRPQGPLEPRFPGFSRPPYQPSTEARFPEGRHRPHSSATESDTQEVRSQQETEPSDAGQARPPISPGFEKSDAEYAEHTSTRSEHAERGGHPPDASLPSIDTDSSGEREDDEQGRPMRLRRPRSKADKTKAPEDNDGPDRTGEGAFAEASGGPGRVRRARSNEKKDPATPRTAGNSQETPLDPQAGQSSYSTPSNAREKSTSSFPPSRSRRQTSRAIENERTDATTSGHLPSFSPPPPTDVNFGPAPSFTDAPRANYPSGEKTTSPETTFRIPATVSPHSWPDLPDTDQLMREEIHEPRRWKRQMRDWERRKRLNREQRGELWSE